LDRKVSELIKIETGGEGLALPVDKEVLGKFISSLLGQPQTLERVIEAPFSVSHQWLIHLCSLLMQRINQQNAPRPISFEAVIGYENGVSRRVTSFDAFQIFSETQNIVSESIHISIGLLIQFPGKETPEKQEIIFGLKTNNKEFSLLKSWLSRNDGTGLAVIEIHHTERTWADDIFGLIEKELGKVQAEESAWKHFVRKAFFPFATFMAPLFAIGSVLVQSWRQTHARDILENQLKDLLVNNPEPNLLGLHQKADLLLLGEINRFSSNNFFSVFPLLMAFVLAAILFTLGLTLAKPSPSFLLLSKESEKQMEKILGKQKRSVIVFVGSVIFALVLGVSGNYIYDYIK
jgi:hypothetical protein